MKKLIIIYIIFLYTHSVCAVSVSFLNMMSQQAHIEIQTKNHAYTTTVNPNENFNIQKTLDHPAHTQYDNSLTTMNIDKSPIKKIIIKRLQSDIPQIIYYNDEITNDNHKQPIGIYALSLSNQGVIKLTSQDVTINNKIYSIQDVSSLKSKSDVLKKMLNNTVDINFETFEQETNDLAESLRLFEGSHMANILTLQLAVIRSDVDYLVNKIQIIHQIQDYIDHIQDVTTHVNDDNVDEVENKLNNMIAGLQTLDQTQLPQSINIDKIKQDIQKLQLKINEIRKRLDMMKRPMLVDQM